MISYALGPALCLGVFVTVLLLTLDSIHCRLTTKTILYGALLSGLFAGLTVFSLLRYLSLADGLTR